MTYIVAQGSQIIKSEYSKAFLRFRHRTGTVYHFHHILLAKVITGPAQIQGEQK